MGATSVKNIGDTNTRVTAESGGIKVADTVTRTVVMKGPYDTLEDQVLNLRRGMLIDGMALDTATLSRQPGNVGKMILELVPDEAFLSIPSSAERETIEIEMAQIERPLLTHSKISEEMGKNLGLWWSGTDDKLKAAHEYIDDEGDKKTLTQDEQKWADKMLNGVESYLVFAPVITKTSIYESRPKTQKAGMIDTPPENVDGYEYLKTADVVRQLSRKEWERVEQWTGADEWDEDIYSTGGA